MKLYRGEQRDGSVKDELVFVVWLFTGILALETKCPVQIARLKKPSKAAVDSRVWMIGGIADKGHLILFIHILPVL